MKRRKTFTKIVSMMLVVLMIFALTSPVGINGEKLNGEKSISLIEREAVVSAEEKGAEDLAIALSEGKGTPEEKKETVFAKADAAGKVSKITVTELLKNVGNNKKVEDFTILENIKNTEGDEEYILDADGTLLWENSNNNISYEGIADKELPVNVKVRYFFESREVAPSEMAGVTGEIKIRFEYENKTSQIVEVNGKEVECVVPFMVCSMLYLPTEIFSNVEAVNGKVIENNEQILVVGYAMPGLQEELGLSECELTEEINLPEYFEITADASEFELEFTATIATTGIFDELKNEDLDELEDAADGVNEMDEAIGEMADGTTKLQDGVEEIKGYFSEYLKGVDALAEGTGQLEEGVGELKKQNKNLRSAAKALYQGLAELNKSIDLGLSADGNDFQEILTALLTLAKEAEMLKTSLQTMEDSIDGIEAFVGQVKEYKTLVEQKYSNIEARLAEIDLAAENQAIRDASQAAVGEVLAESGLSEEQIAVLSEAISAKMSDVDFTAGINGKIEAVKNELLTKPQLEIPELNLDKESMFALIADMENQALIVQAGSEQVIAMLEKLGTMTEALSSLKEAIGQLETGSGQLFEGIKAYTSGVATVYEGVKALESGAKELANAGGEFNEGFDALIEGIGTMKDGIYEFKEEGLKELKDIVGDEFIRVIDSLRAAKILNDGYNNYAGIGENVTGSVVFIIETEGIEK